MDPLQDVELHKKRFLPCHVDTEIFSALGDRYFYLRHRPHQSQSLGHSAPVLLSMESSAVLKLSQLPYFSPQKSNRERVSPSWPCKPRSSQPTRLRCQKMYVPGGYTVFLCVSNTYVYGRKERKKERNTLCISCIWVD